MGVDFHAVRFNRAKGWMEIIPGTPDHHFCNSNAGIVLDALGLDLAPDYCGSMKPEEFDRRFQRYEAAFAQGRGEEFARTTTDTGPDTEHCRVISFGISAEDVRRRLHALALVVKFAREHGGELGWG